MKEKTPAQNLTIYYLVALLPLILYGFYKNGIVLYNKDLIGFVECIKPLFMPIIGFMTGFIVEYLFNMKNDDRLNKQLKETFLPLYGLVLGCIVNPSINFFIYFIVLFGGFCLVKIIQKQKIISINAVSFTKLAIALVLVLFLTNDYHNLYEKNIPQAISNLDMFLGRGLGGVSSTNIFLCLLSYGFLCFNKYYKKDIPLYMLLTFFTLTIGYSIFTNDPNEIFKMFCVNSLVFAAVFITTDPASTPYTKKGRLTYGIILGIISFLAIIFLTNFEGVFIAIAISSLFIKIIDNIFALK